MRYRPATIRSVVLDSVVPTQNEFSVEAPASFNNSISSLAAGCAADAACNAAYPDLLGKWDSLYARLNAEPAVLPIVNLENGELIDYIPINGWDLTSIFFNLLYGTGNIPLLPFFIGEAADGNYEVLSLLLSLLLQPSDGPAPPPQSETALTLYYLDSVLRRLPVRVGHRFYPHSRPEPPRPAGFGRPGAERSGQGAVLQPRTGRRRARLCRRRQFRPACRPLLSPASTTRSRRRTTLTPPRRRCRAPSRWWSTHTAATRPPRSARAWLNAVAQFLNDPSATPDTSCIADEAPLPFVLPEQAQASFQTMLQDSSWMLWLR